ncbi:haloacid dehalogenase-like hydrolase [Ralstonia solanacearum]|nr:haloacid dehalogenase-like hydrolase [Ralstonia solanacearum]
MSRLFEQNRIAIVWDFDKTLIPRYMQVPLFERYDIAEQGFWDEVGAGSKHIESHGQKVNHETFYLNVLLRHVRDGRMGGLDNATLRRLGAELEFFPGVADFFERSKAWVAGNPAYQAFDIKLEHYIVSTGLTEMIKGSPIAPHIDGVWGCEFLEVPDAGGRPVISEVIYAIDNTTKTRALFEINKGVNKHPEAVSVNASMAEDERRVPFANMIYVADGPSDIPAFSVARKGGGRTYAVYNPDSPRSFEQGLKLHIGKIADTIVHGKQEILRETTRGIPQHFVEPKRAVP